MQSQISFSADATAALVELALQQSQRENVLRQQIKDAVERRDVLEVFRLSELFTGGDGVIAATLDAHAASDCTGTSLKRRASNGGPRRDYKAVA